MRKALLLLGLAPTSQSSKLRVKQNSKPPPYLMFVLNPPSSDPNAVEIGIMKRARIRLGRPMAGVLSHGTARLLRLAADDDFATRRHYGALSGTSYGFFEAATHDEDVSVRLTALVPNGELPGDDSNRR